MAGAAAVALALAACAGSGGGSSKGGAGGGSSSGALPSTIKIGVPLDTSGSAQITGVGTDEKAGVDFAVKQINDSGFLGNAKISTVEYNTQAAKTQAVARTTQLVDQDKVAAIVGYSLTPSFLAAGPIAQKAGIPVMTVGLSGAGITNVGNHIFRELLDYANLFKIGDPQFIKATGGKTAAFLYGSDTVTTSGQYKKRKALLEGLGIKTVASQSITADSTNIASQLTTIKNAHPDYFVIDVDTGQVPAVLTQAASVGINAQVLGDNGLAAKATLSSAAASKAAQCGLFAIAWDASSTAGGNQQFVSDWKAANGGAAPDLFNALGRDAMWGMATAIKQAQSTNGDKITTALHALNADLQGALGSYKWSADGQPTYQPLLEQIQNGKAVAWTPSTTCSR